MNQENVAIMKELKERLQRRFSFMSETTGSGLHS